MHSLIKYATLSDYMLVPTDLYKLEGVWAEYPEMIPGYGERAWCRTEYFLFSLAAEMRKSGVVELYAIQRDGKLQAYPSVKVRQ